MQQTDQPVEVCGGLSDNKESEMLITIFDQGHVLNAYVLSDSDTA